MTRLNIAYRLLFGISLLMMCLLSPLLADAITPVESNGISVTQYWFEDHDMKLTSQEALEVFKQGDAVPLNHSVFQLGNEPVQAWVLISIHNQSTDSAQLRLLTGAPYSRLLKAELVGARPRILIDEHEEQPFAARNNTFRLLNSEGFQLAAGETAEVLIQTLVEGPSYLPFKILTADEFAQIQQTDGVFGALFYGFTATLGLLFLLFSIAVRHRIALLYAGLFLLGLVAMSDIDGYAFKFLWPNSPDRNHFSPMVILPLLNGLGFLIIHQLISSVDAAKHTLIRKAALVMAMVSLLIPLLLPVVPFSTLIQLQNLIAIPAFLFQPIAFTSWLHLGRRSYISLFALLMIALVIVGLVATVFIDAALPTWLMEHLHHFAYVVVGVMVMGIITVQLMGLHKDQQAALNRELALAQKNAQMNQDLLNAEKNFARAQRLASQHKQRLATVSHDLRQPIVSLRSSIDAIAQNQTIEVRQQLSDAFQYLEELCNRHLQHAQTDDSGASLGEEEATASVEAYPASLILNTVQRMFSKEAISRGIELRKFDCSVMLTTEPLVLMRIISNLTANAIKHHSGVDGAKVLLGCRRLENGLKILVCDNGAGMSAEQIEACLQPYHKGDESEGEGLGLAIVQQLATEHALRLELRSELGRGSCFGVLVIKY